MEFIDSGRTVTIAGQALPKLSPNDRKKLMAGLKAARRALLKENLKDGGISGEAYVNELDAFDQSEFGDYEFYRFMGGIEGRAEVIGLAATKGGIDAVKLEEVLTGLEVGEDFKLAALLAGVKLKDRDEAAEKLAMRRANLKQDMKDAGIQGEEFLAKLDAFDVANEHEEPPANPSEAGA